MAFSGSRERGGLDLTECFVDATFAAKYEPDGPFAETMVLIAGYSLWQVKSKEEAIEWVKRCPNPVPGKSEIEIRQVFEAWRSAPDRFSNSTRRSRLW